MNNKDKILLNYYAGISELIDCSFINASNMIEKGFSLLHADFGGYVDTYNQAQFAEIEIFEIERIKEEVISLLTRNMNGTVERHGYKSKYLDEALLEISIVRDDLYSVNRKEYIEKALKSKPWGHFYTNDFRKRFVKLIDEGIIAEERKREASHFNLQPLLSETKINSQLDECLHKTFLDLGLHKIKNKYNKYQSIYITNESYISNNFSDKKTNIEFAVQTDSMTEFQFPCSVEIYFKPVVYEKQDDCIYNEFNNNIQLFRNISLLIPGFGVYRVAKDSLEASLMLHAYRYAIEHIVNAFSTICTKTAIRRTK